MNVLQQIPANLRKRAYELFGLLFAVLYAKGVVSDSDVDNWKDLAGILVPVLARVNVQED